MFELSGKVALVTGAASGIGAEVVRALTRQRAIVAGADVLTDFPEGCASTHHTDVTDEAAVHECVRGVLDQHGRIDVLINSAGVALLGAARDFATTDWRRTMDVNLTGSFLMCRAVGRGMIEQGGGRMINLASQAASVGLDGHVAYCASKAGVLGMTRTLALEWGGSGVTVNAVSPTVVLTELGRAAWDNPAGEAHRSEIPTGRFAEPHEIAAAVAYLSSDEAAMVNGAELRVDGGFTAR